MISKAVSSKLTTMIAGGITEAGLWQSAVLMTDLKTAYLVQASPKIMFYAQILGSVMGAFISSGVYRLFTTVYNIQVKNFPPLLLTCGQIQLAWPMEEISQQESGHFYCLHSFFQLYCESPELWLIEEDGGCGFPVG